MMVTSGSISLQSHQVSVTPSSAGLNVLDEHCIPDRDRIPFESIHDPLAIFKSFSCNVPPFFVFLMKFLYPRLMLGLLACYLNYVLFASFLLFYSF